MAVLGAILSGALGASPRAGAQGPGPSGTWAPGLRIMGGG